MENREIVAYLLLAVMFTALFVAYRYATRERRIHHRATRAAERRTVDRIKAGASGS